MGIATRVLSLLKMPSVTREEHADAHLRERLLEREDREQKSERAEDVGDTDDSGDRLGQHGAHRERGAR